MTPHRVGNVEVSISVIAETMPDGERWFASAHFHGTHDGDRIAGVFDYSYTPFRTQAEAAEDALRRTTQRLRQMLGDDIDVAFARAPGGAPDRLPRAS